MKLPINTKSTIIAVIAIVSGVIVLLGYFVDALTGVQSALLQGAVTLSAVVLLIGVINLARVHWRRFKTNQKGGIYSLVLLISLLLTIVITGFSIGFLGPDSQVSLWIYSYIQVPIESSLMALLAVILVYAVARMLNRQINVYSLLFIGALVLALLSSVAIPFFDLPALRQRIAQGLEMVAIAGARGILLGVALGTVATGLRILMGADRPYGE